MDVIRPPEVLRRKKRRRVIQGAVVVVLLLITTLGLARLKPAAPTVERATVWVDTVKRGPMLRQVRGMGTLVPEEIRWIPSVTDGRLERIVVQPGSAVKPDTVILEFSNPELELQALDAEAQFRSEQANLTELQVRLASQRLDQEAAAARVKAEYEQAKLRAETDRQLADQGLVADLNRKLSELTANESS